MIVLIMERAVEREARKLTTLMLMDDAVRGFPSTSHEGSMLALVDEGARGGVTAGLAALIDGARIFPVIAPGQIAEPFVVDFGIWEGRRASPRQFGGQTRGTLAAARRTEVEFFSRPPSAGRRLRFRRTCMKTGLELI